MLCVVRWLLFLGPKRGHRRQLKSFVLHSRVRQHVYVEKKRRKKGA